MIRTQWTSPKSYCVTIDAINKNAPSEMGFWVDKIIQNEQCKMELKVDLLKKALNIQIHINSTWNTLTLYP